MYIKKPKRLAVCVVCGKEFMTHHPHARGVCGPECKKATYRVAMLTDARVIRKREIERRNRRHGRCSRCGVPIAKHDPRNGEDSGHCRQCGTKARHVVKREVEAIRRIGSNASSDGALRLCKGCGRAYRGNGCSRTKECRKLTERMRSGKPRTRMCVRCGVKFTDEARSNSTRHCQSCTSAIKREVRADGKRMRRAMKRAVQREGFKALEIYKRDGYVCQLCGQKTRPDYGSLHDLYPSLDHIVPLSRGGPHTRVNAQCAHRICNSRKQAIACGQLRLFG